jgi:4-hydroxy-3-methylbut-2-enyl diphosphate reductase IspH
MAIELKVVQSKIKSVGAGVARINSEHLSELGEEIPELIVVKSEKHKKVVKLVSDRLAPKENVVLREDDIEDLKVEEGDTITILPYSTLSEDMKDLWKRMKDKFKKDEEEEEEEEED